MYANISNQDIYNFINNRDLPRVNNEECSNIVQGNIGVLLADKGKTLNTPPVILSSLGVFGSYMPLDEPIRTNGETQSLSGEKMSVPFSFTSKTPLSWGENGFGISWGILNNSYNNIGNELDYNSNRVLFFPKYVDKDVTINTLPHFPAVEHTISNNLKVPKFKEITENLPIKTPVKNWHSTSPIHQSGLGNSKLMR